MNLGSLLAQPSPNLFNDQHRCIVRVNARLALTQHLHQGFIALPEPEVVTNPHPQTKMQIDQV